MTTALDTKIAAKVLTVLATYGVNLTLYEETDYTYDEATGIGTSASPNSRIVKATPLQSFDRKLIDGDVVRIDDALTYIAGTVAREPEIGMKVTVNGENWDVVAVRPILSGDDTALYELHLRR